MKGLRGRRTALAAAGLLLASASGAHAPSAHAQMAIETGSRTARPAPAAINDSPDMKPEERAGATMLAYTTCLVRRHAPGVRRALALAENTGAAQKALLDLADTDCLADGQLRMSLPLFRAGCSSPSTSRTFRRRARASAPSRSTSAATCRRMARGRRPISRFATSATA